MLVSPAATRYHTMWQRVVDKRRGLSLVDATILTGLVCYCISALAHEGGLHLCVIRLFDLINRSFAAAASNHDMKLNERFSLVLFFMFYFEIQSATLTTKAQHCAPTAHNGKELGMDARLIDDATFGSFGFDADSPGSGDLGLDASEFFSALNLPMEFSAANVATD